MSLVGQQIGRYRILEQLGSGGMSVVYKGLDTALDREVAVKVLHPHLAEKEESRRRLAREAKAVARLHHPNILEVFDFSSPESGDAYIVTEYIRGQTLRQLASDQAMDPPEVAAMVIRELAAALAHAHEAGIIHRDLKPENVMVREDGVLKLMDFGIAKMIDRDERMTITGALVGSPAHMAPEIIEGHEAGPEADIFSLGTILYLYATGRLPFVATNTTATLKRILDGSYDDPRQLAPKVSDDLAEIIGKCLARDPDDRYEDAAHLRDALDGYLAALAIDRPSEELAGFFADPASYRAGLTVKLVAQLVRRGTQAWTEEQRPARALSLLNHALALEPGNAPALRLLDEMNVARRRQKLIAQTVRSVGALALVAALAVAGTFATRWIRQHLAAQKTNPPSLPVTIATHTPIETPKPSEPAKQPVKSPDQRPTPRPATAPHRAAPLKPPPVAVIVHVKPFGFLRVDGGPKTDELSQHALSLTPGKHHLRIGCHFCDETKQTLEVAEAEGQEFHEVAQLRPSRVSFVVDPPSAVVRIADEQRAAAETQARPFVVRSPQGPLPGRHHVEYQISAPGFRTLRDVAEVEPEQSVTVTGKLTPE